MGVTKCPTQACTIPTVHFDRWLFMRISVPETDPLRSSLMRQASYKCETPRLELKSSWTFLAIKLCQGTKSKKVIKRSRSSSKKLAHICIISGLAVKTTPSSQFDMRFGGSTLMTSPQNNTWVALVVCLGSLIFALSAHWWAQGTLILRQYPTRSNNFLSGTPVKAIRKPACILPMINLVHARDRAFKMASIMFCVGTLIPLSKNSCQCRVQDFAYVGNVETWYKNLPVWHCGQRNLFLKKIWVDLSSWKRHVIQKC